MMSDIVSLSMYTVTLAQDHHILLDKAMAVKEWFMQALQKQKEKKKGKGKEGNGEAAGALPTPSTAASSAGGGDPEVVINTNPTPYIFMGWISIMNDVLSEEQYKHGKGIGTTLTRIERFFREYAEPRKMVQDGIRVARIATTFAHNMLKIEWSVGIAGSCYQEIATDFGVFLVTVFGGEMKFGAAPLSANERLLSNWLSERRTPPAH